MISRLTNYFKDSWIELTKVSWPTRKQALQLTIIVVIFSIVVAGFIGAVDYGFGQILEKVILKK